LHFPEDDPKEHHQLDRLSQYAEYLADYSDYGIHYLVPVAAAVVLATVEVLVLVVVGISTEVEVFVVVGILTSPPAICPPDVVFVLMLGCTDFIALDHS
jgi:hypothetical protein